MELATAWRKRYASTSDANMHKLPQLALFAAPHSAGATAAAHTAAAAHLLYPSLSPPNFSCPAVSHTLNLMGPLLVWNTSGRTSTPSVAVERGSTRAQASSELLLHSCLCSSRKRAELGQYNVDMMV
eukprot:2580-Heterococcus_DN1.PRE.2